MNLQSSKPKPQQAGAELCQAQAKLEVVVEIGVEFGVEVDACHYYSGWVGGIKQN